MMTNKHLFCVGNWEGNRVGFVSSRMLTKIAERSAVQFYFILFLFLFFIGCLMYLAICSGYVYLCITFVSVPFILSYGVIGNNCGCGSSRSYIFPFCSVSFPILDVEIASYVRF
ncbi:hypothetical protein AAZX31_16G067300 [Glycine max]|uniref:Uncharacterized protein n=2 Tax=Glycine subgen. Soja TaxID=1462606 RepID=A0A0R0FW90_SOYBN|nr:hypothetical protein JHK86_044622 [Glycine max]KAG4951364.1 hypothetical protein JHK85_045231 [Glycine max]KAH1150360.1 hypothetical protein GYH30_044393 [Glycine max]KRH07177.1 hypothetical protein GLYMA_16G072100v4 [Glycine max]RZB59975.1 hypothetical protein D0Y65_042950 [Glycine soja]